MKEYVIYKDVPNLLGRGSQEIYRKEDGSFTENISEAKVYKVKWWVDVLKIIKIIYIILNESGILDKLKYKQK